MISINSNANSTESPEDLAARKNVLAIAFFFPPDAGSGSIRNVKILKYLPSLGWNMRVLTHDDQSYDGRESDELNRQIPDECEVIRTRYLDLQGFVNRCIRMVLPKRMFGKATPAQDETTADASPAPAASQDDTASKTKTKPSLSRRIMNFIDRATAVPDRFVGWFPFALWAGIREVRRKRPDVIYAVGKPWTGLLVGYLLKLFCRRPLVVDLMDPWSMPHWNPGKNGRLFLWIDRRMESFILRRSDFVVANTATLRQDIIERLKIDPRRVGVITCGFDRADFTSGSDTGAPPDATKKNGLPFTVTHTGTFYGRRSPLPFLAATKRLIQSNAVPAEHLKINFIGRIGIDDRELSQLLDDPLIDPILHTESWVPHSTALDFLYQSHVLLLVQPDTKLQIPAKLYEYAATRRPVLALCDTGGAVDQIMQTEEWGEVVESEDVDGIADSLLRAYQRHMNDDGTRLLDSAGVDRYSTVSLAGRLSDMLDSVRKPSAAKAAKTKELSVQ